MTMELKERFIKVSDLLFQLNKEINELRIEIEVKDAKEKIKQQ